jgi:uncharacterized membrane protein YedE/YeeE
MTISINWDNFSPISALIGGVLIGLSVVLLALFKGRIAGISGILGALMQFKNTPKDHYLWRILFILGLLLSSFLYSLILPLPKIQINNSVQSLVLAGLMVGLGTRMGSGCTSGHGICGLGRLSIRSMIATLSFMLAGFIGCYFFLHLL